MTRNKNNFIHIGNIVNTHGLKGELRILSDSDKKLERFEKNKTINIEVNGELKPFKIISSRQHKNFILLIFENLNNINEVEVLKNKKIYVQREEGEMVVEDFVDYDIYNNEQKISKLTEIINIGPYSSFVFWFNAKKVNVPFVEKYVIEINYDKKYIKLNIPKEFF